MNRPLPGPGRRQFLAAGVAWLLPGLSAKPDRPDRGRSSTGIFPIVQTPYTKNNKVAFDELAKEVEFLDRAGAHGIVWPQRASEYAYLSFEERVEGAKVVVQANRGRKPAVVIGVQGSDTAEAIRYARHAERLQPDAIIALPTRDRGQFDLNELGAYYAAIARACSRPLFVQTTGNMSIDFVLRMAGEIPTLRFVKDEAGNTLARLEEFRKKDPDGRIAVFTGDHGRTLTDELARGVAGNMPASGWVDLYVKVWNLWRAGKRHEALDVFSKVLLFVTQATAYGFPALHYILHLRGVFSNWKVRGPDQRPLDRAGEGALRQTYEFVRPYLTA
jgi:4-hydroxy-tetrahydrodipicolinate synthase